MDEALERRAELAAVVEAYGDARRGLGSLLLVRGPAGIGKSTLLDLAAGRADGLRVLRARADELERELPFGVARQLFERLLAAEPELRARVLVDAAQLAGDVLAPGSGSAAMSPAEATHALTWLTANLAAQRPLALVVDDVHWVDDASARWLHHLAGRLDEQPVVLVLAVRDGVAGAADVGALADGARAVELGLAPLTADGVAAVVRSARGADVDDRVCVACAELTEGNPFLVHELLRSLRDLAAITVEDVRGARPAAVARSVGRRLGRLTPAAQRVAETCAVLGDGAELRHAAALAELDVATAASAVDELVETGILRAGAPLGFVHPLVRSATYQRLGAQTAARAHAVAAQLLADESVDPQQVAKHLLLAPPLNEPWVARQLLSAGSAALTGGAATEARSLLARALAEPPPPDLRSAAELALGLAEFRLLDAAAAPRLQHVVDSSDDPRQQAQAASTLAVLRTMQGDLPDVEAIERVADRLGPGDRELALDVRANAVSAGLLQYAAMPEAGRRVEELAAGLTGATPAERRLLGALSYHLIVEGDTSADRCADLAVKALGDGRLVEESGETSAAWQTALGLLITGRHRHADLAIEAGLRRATAHSSETTFAVWSVVGCYGGWLAGRLEQAEAHGRAARRVAEASGMWLPRLATAAYLGRVLIDRDELVDAERLLTEVEDEKHAGTTVYDTVAFTMMLLRAEQRRWGDVVDLGEGVASRVGGARNPGILWRLPAAVAMARLGDRTGARALLEEQRRATERWALPRARALLFHSEGLVLGGRDGIARTEDAVRLLEAAGERLELARALVTLGGLLRSDRQRTAAREVFGRALDVADRCGALRLVSIAEEEIRACGGSVRRRRLTGVEALTPSELRVARMAADGMTNTQIAQALFVTRKTVESQLSATYRKLGVPSRDALTGLLAERAP
ncbi:AAA family ATPase [Nocardioides sp. MH1]|uniref:helix-turn-helix transcriptional regulator n=1 Tax=Nocardioides sp. MH1 TaxID=3242490 RepID=UPI00352007A7